MVAPAPVAAIHTTDNNPAMAEVIEQTQETPIKQQHAVAAVLLGYNPASGAEIENQPNDVKVRKGGSLDISDNQELVSNSNDKNTVDPRIAELMSSDLSDEEYPSGQTGELLLNHSRSAELLKMSADHSARLDSRINTSTKLLLIGDRRMVQRNIEDTQQKFEANKKHLSQSEQEQIQSQINRANSLIKSSRTPATAESTTELLDQRKNRLNNLYEAWNLAVDAEDSVTQLSPVSINIESRGDPIRNGSVVTNRNITGTVTGADPEDIDEVLITVNGNNTVTADLTQSNSSKFSASVSLSERVNTIAASVTTVPVSESGEDTNTPNGGTGGTPQVDGGSDGADLTRDLPITVTDSFARGYISPSTSSATVSYDDSDVPVQRFRLDSTAAPEQSFGRLQAYQFETFPSGYPTVPGEFIVGVDVAVRETSPVAGAPADILMQINESQLSTENNLQLSKYNRDSEEWVRQESTVQQSGDTLDVTVSNVSNPDTIFVLTSTGNNNSNEGGSSPTTSDQDDTSTEQDDSEMSESDQPDIENTDQPNQGDRGIISSIINSIREFITGEKNLFQSIPSAPIGVVEASDTTTQQSNPTNLRIDDSTVSQTEQEPIIRSTVLFLDGDGLSDTFETSELGSDPLNPNSNLSTTNSNESTNSIVDGAEDPDNDTALNAVESSIGTDPLISDTDEDGLSDSVESRFKQFNSTVADTNNDGISDGQSDPDNDGLTTVEEIQQGTSPVESDTDTDGLSDEEEINPSSRTPATNPLAPDTDEDGLSDSEELKLGTDPTNPDSDGDGTIDGNETFVTSANESSVGTTIDITGEGNIAESLTISEDETSTLNTSTVQAAQASPIINLDAEDEFDSANISINYDPSRVSNESELSMYRLNSTTGSFQPLNSTVSEDTNSVTAKTDQFSRFVVFEVPEWESNYEAIEPPNVGDDQSVAPVDAAFILDSSGSMATNDPNDIRKQAAKEFTGALLDIDRASVIDFDFNAQVTQSLTSDFQAVNGSIDQIDSSGGTNIGAGISEANSEYAQNSDNSRAKIAILLTDGRGSGGINQAETAAQQNVTIFTIGLSRATNAQKLNTIADKTGGNFTQVNRAEDLPDIFSRIANETQSDDTDGDGLTDAEEIGGIRIQGGETPTTTVRTDPFDPDTDNDGIPDGVEAGTKTTNTVSVNIASSGGSGLEQTYNRTVFNANSNPTRVDSDGDGLPDAGELDDYEIRYTDSASDTQSFEDTIDVQTTPQIELSDVSPFLSVRTVSPDPLSADTDNDGLQDGEEISIGTDPTSADTDGDLINDSREHLNLSSEDPTLFDNQRPEITIKSISVSTVPDEEGDLADVFDTEYTVRYNITDPAGVSSVTVERGDAQIQKSYTDTAVDDTVSIVAESFLAQGSQFALGARVDIKAVDENQNGISEDPITKAGPDLLKKATKLVGNTLPNFYQSPLFNLALLRGALDTLVGILEGLLTAVTSFIDLIKEILTNPNGALADEIKQIQNAATVLIERPIEVLETYLSTYRQDMRSGNPFTLPSGANNEIDALQQRFNISSDNFELSDLLTASDYLVFALGYYAGLIAFEVASTVIGALSGTIIANLSGKLQKILNLVKTIATIGNDIGDKFATINRAARAVEQVDRIPPDGIVAGLGEVSAVRSIEVVDIITNQIAFSPENALRQIAGSLPVSLSQSSSFLTQYATAIAAADVDKTRAVQAAQTDSPSTAGVLISNTTDDRADRVIVRGIDSGRLTEAEAVKGLSTISNQSSNTARTRLANLIGSSGIEGVKFIAETGSQSNTVVLRVEQDSSVSTAQLAEAIRQAGGSNVSAVARQTSPGFIINILQIDDGAANIAQAKLLSAVADSSVTTQQVTALLNDINAKSQKERAQVINELAFANNTTEVSQVIDEQNIAPSNSIRGQPTDPKVNQIRKVKTVHVLGPAQPAAPETAKLS